MPDLAFVVFDEEKNKEGQSLLVKSGLLKRYFAMTLFRLINRKKFRSGIKAIQLDSANEFLSIGLPFARSSLERLNTKYLACYVSRICSENGCARCFFPPAVRWTEDFKEYCTGNDARLNVFKGLLLPILNELYIKAGVRLDSLDIAFICGEDRQGLLTMVTQLEPFVKCINIVSSGRESLDSRLADLCSDSGLSVFTSGDFGRMLRNADLIISLENVNIISRYRIRPHTLVINFGSGGFRVPRGEYPIINGVELTFPDEYLDVFGEDILHNYPGAELAELLFSAKAGLFDTCEYNKAVADMAVCVFKSCQCHITGFIGRRGVFRPEEMQKALGQHY